MSRRSDDDQGRCRKDTQRELSADQGRRGRRIMEWNGFLEKNRDEMIRALQRVIRINSEQKDRAVSDDGSVYPFGRGVQEALEETLNIGRELGFEVKNVDNY